MIICRGHRPCSAQVYAFVPTTFGGSGGVQVGGVGDDTVYVEDDRRERRVRRWDVVACAAVWLTAWPMRRCNGPGRRRRWQRSATSRSSRSHRRLRG
jgi:hypothetical protein